LTVVARLPIRADSLWLRRANSVGHERQHLNLPATTPERAIGISLVGVVSQRCLNALDPSPPDVLAAHLQRVLRTRHELDGSAWQEADAVAGAEVAALVERVRRGFGITDIGASQFEGTGETAWGTKWVHVAVRSTYVHGRVILDVDWVPSPGTEPPPP
jgi:hypothetical protein